MVQHDVYLHLQIVLNSNVLTRRIYSQFGQVGQSMKSVLSYVFDLVVLQKPVQTGKRPIQTLPMELNYGKTKYSNYFWQKKVS